VVDYALLLDLFTSLLDSGDRQSEIYRTKTSKTIFALKILDA
jgi:hypothetical protein